MPQPAQNPTNPATRRPTPRRARRSARSRGAVIVLGLLGAFMCAAMIGYVFNTGRHAQLRQQTQHAADATAISGAGYVARSFNTVAMNNVEISRLIAAVHLLDAMPLATEYTLVDVQAFRDRIENQIATGGAASSIGNYELQQYASDLADMERWLAELDQLLNRSGYDIREMTFYDGPSGRGEMWKAMESLDAISLATMEQLEQLTQVTAIEAGQRGMRGQSMAAIAPFTSAIAWQRYTIDDFQDPVTNGQLPDWVDNQVTNRGPYDTVFGWRFRQTDRFGGVPNPNFGESTSTSTRPSSPWSGRTGRSRGPRMINQESVTTGYWTYGTRRWLINRLRAAIDNATDTLQADNAQQREILETQFRERIEGMSSYKHNYLFPGTVRSGWRLYDPQWITDYDQAVEIIESGTPEPNYAMYLRMEFQQLFINGQAQGPEQLASRTELKRYRRQSLLNVPGANKTGNHVWEDQATEEWQVTRIERDRNGDPVEVVDEYRLEYRWEFVWLGINVGPRIDIRDPNPTGRSEDLPSPIDFDHAAMQRPVDGQVGQPGSPFTFLGLAMQPNRASLWPSLFDTSAFNQHTAIAQASVFNNHSWDLWTQMWHAQLEPVQNYDQWIAIMQQQTPAAAGYPDLSVGQLQEMIDYLQAVQPLAPVMLNH